MEIATLKRALNKIGNGIYTYDKSVQISVDGKTINVVRLSECIGSLVVRGFDLVGKSVHYVINEYNTTSEDIWKLFSEINDKLIDLGCKGKVRCYSEIGKSYGFSSIFEQDAENVKEAVKVVALQMEMMLGLDLLKGKVKRLVKTDKKSVFARANGGDVYVVDAIAIV